MATTAWMIQTLIACDRFTPVFAPRANAGNGARRNGRQISAIFERHKRYPKVSKLREAKVKVSLVLDRLGKVVQLGILQSSGDSLFDEEALAMIRRSEKEIPRPKFELTQDTVSYSLDVNFKGGK